ncbi:MAG: transposase family protein, partial [Chloroflexia bacterium]
YTITLLDGYSRAILASLLSRSQDLAAVLMVLYAAIRQHGVPTALVTDSGGVFLAHHAQRIYAGLGIRKAEIARRQAWQSLIEANFGVQMRMADYHFAKATTWAELLRVHEQWMADFNAQMHWAHRLREDGRRSPDEVLDGALGVAVNEEALRRIFFTLRLGRVLDARGYARLRHWKMYGERGLAGRPVGLWLYGPQLTVEHRDEPLAQFQVAYAPGKRLFKAARCCASSRHRSTAPAVALPARRRPVAQSLPRGSVCGPSPSAFPRDCTALALPCGTARGTVIVAAGTALLPWGLHAGVAHHTARCAMSMRASVCRTHPRVYPYG